MNVMLIDSFVRTSRNIGIAIGGPLAGQEINSSDCEYVRRAETPVVPTYYKEGLPGVGVVTRLDRYHYFDNFFRLRTFKISAWVHESLMDGEYMSDGVVTHLIEAYKKQTTRA